MSGSEAHRRAVGAQIAATAAMTATMTAAMTVVATAATTAGIGMNTAGTTAGIGMNTAGTTAGTRAAALAADRPLQSPSPNAIGRSVVIAAQSSAEVSSMDGDFKAEIFLPRSLWH